MAAAEQSAVSSQAFHRGESSLAFQASHHRFLEVAAKVNMLLDVAPGQPRRRFHHLRGGDAAAANAYNLDSPLQKRKDRPWVQIMYNYPAMLGTSPR